MVYNIAQVVYNIVLQSHVKVSLHQLKHVLYILLVTITYV